MQDPIDHNQLNAYFRAVREQLEALPLPNQHNAHALRVAELLGAASAAASTLSATLAQIDPELDALEADLAAEQAERERLAAERA